MTTTLDLTQDYQTIRTHVGVYPITAPLVRLTGYDRLELLDTILSKGSDFVDPDTTREALALNADGSPFAIVLHLELADESWIYPRTPVSAEVFGTYLNAFAAPGDTQVEIAPEGWGAVAFEGPEAWQLASTYVDYDISGLILHAIVPVTLPGAEASTAQLARVGSTGEYGYLLLSDAPEIALAAVSGAAEAVGGGRVDGGGLARVQSEAGMPYYSQGLGGLSVSDADLAWIVSWDRAGEFFGSAGLTEPTRQSARLTALVAPAGAVVAAGAEVLASDVVVGTVRWQVPSANPDEELVFAVLQSPFWVSGLDLSVVDADGGAQPLSSVSLPRVLARSSQIRMG